MILIATLNLFVHKTAIVDGLEINRNNTIQDYRLIVGESAIYSAIVIKILQGEPFVLGIAGGIGGRYIKNFMDKNRVKSDFLWKETETRSVLKIIDSVNMTETTFTDDTMVYDEVDLKNFKHKFQINVKNANTVIINNNSSHSDGSNEIIKEILRLSFEHNQKIVISLSGEDLRRALEFRPYAMVINAEDIKELLLDDVEDENQLLQRLHNIVIKHHIKYLVLDHLENKNIYVISKHKICSAKYGKFVKNLEENSKDLLVGALAVAVSRKYEIEKLTKLLAAVKGATQSEQYPKLCQRKDIDDMYHKMKLIELYNNHNSTIN